MDFSDSHAGINLLVGDIHPDKTIMLMSFSFFFLTLKLLFFLGRSKIWMQRACTQVHTHSLKSVLLLISPLHICLLAVCFFPINKALIAFSLECDLACCLWTDLEGPTLTSPSLFFWSLLPHTIIQLHPVAGNKNKQAMEKKRHAHTCRWGQWTENGRCIFWRTDGKGNILYKQRS